MGGGRRRDRLDDTQRTVDNAFNALLPDLNLSGSLTLPTDDDLDFEPGDTSFLASVTFGLPLDREIERLNVRQAQIDRERSIRDYEEFRDSVAVDARSAVRDIDRAKFSVRLQEENIEIAHHRRASIEAAPDRANARERSETQGFMKILIDAETKKILGAALLGIGGDEIIHSIIDIMYAGAPYTTIQRAMHIHPTVAELIPTMLGDLKPLE